MGEYSIGRKADEAKFYDSSCFGLKGRLVGVFRYGEAASSRQGSVGQCLTVPLPNHHRLD